jgi:hypothetical protein
LRLELKLFHFFTLQNFMIFAEVIVYGVEIYLGLGFLFAVWFVASGVTQLDESAKDTGLGFRLIIFFGAAAFWILLAWRLAKGDKRPLENNAHRRKSREAE